ncbi:MAG: hypothetical protein NVS3B25_16000 [Hymenobacter sp.]
MPSHSRFAILARVLLLPAGLIAGTVAGLGSYYEASDDASLAWLFSGVLALKTVASVPLYFHGYGHAGASYPAPGVPWFGVLLGGALAVATVLLFAVLDKLLRPYLRPVPLGVALLVVFELAWVEHWLWFSYVRVALLLAGAAVLFAAQRPGRRFPLLVALAGVGAAWLMRPSLGVLGFGAAVPAALLLAGGWRRAAPLLVAGTVGLGLASGAAALLRTPAEARAQVRDGYFARILDFDQLSPRPRTPADSLGTAAIGLWLLGDSTVVNEALCRRAYGFDVADFVSRQVPAKVSLRGTLLVRDYFPLLLALLATGAVAWQKRGRHPEFWLVQLSFAGGLVAFAGWLKLPPRLALPLLDFWLLANLAYLLKESIRPTGEDANSPWPSLRGWRFGTALVVAVGLVYGAKTLHRRQVLRQEQRHHERALAELSRLTAGRPRVLAGTNDLLKSLSPFRVYGLGAGPTLMLSGWPSHDESQTSLRRSWTGAADQTECLRRLANPARCTQWVLSAETATWLNRRFRYRAGAGPGWVFRPGPALAADSLLRFYQPFLH